MVLDLIKYVQQWLSGGSGIEVKGRCFDERWLGGGDKHERSERFFSLR